MLIVLSEGDTGLATRKTSGVADRTPSGVPARALIGNAIFEPIGVATWAPQASERDVKGIKCGVVEDPRVWLVTGLVGSALLKPVDCFS